MTPTIINEVIEYDPDTGMFRWKVRTGKRCKPGWFAGNLGAVGYLRIKVGGELWFAHRLAWFLTTGQMPPEGMHVEHENLIKTDNRLSNLRLATPQQNTANSPKPKTNRSGFKGVHWSHHKTRPWKAQIGAHGKVRNLGYFATPEEAHEEYMRHARAAYGEFARAE
jgi:HNH endonuclease